MLQAGRSRDRILMSLDFYNLPNPSSALWPCGRLSLQQKYLPGTVMVLRKGRPARKPDSLTAICEQAVLEDLGASTSHAPMGLHGLLRGIPLLLLMFLF
jgi:hypothetical protein